MKRLLKDAHVIDPVAGRNGRFDILLEGDRIAELWDVGQEVPAETPNANGMF